MEVNNEVTIEKRFKDKINENIKDILLIKLYKEIDNIERTVIKNGEYTKEQIQRTVELHNDINKIHSESVS